MLKSRAVAGRRLSVVATAWLGTCAIGAMLSAHAQSAKGSAAAQRALNVCGLPIATEVNGGTQHSTRGSAASARWSCIPPYQTPTYTPPADDGAALSTLLEAAGVSWMYGGNWSGVAAGAFCDVTPRQLAIFMNPTFNILTSGGNNAFGLLGWPTPFHIGGAAQNQNDALPADDDLFPPSNFQSGQRVAEWRAVIAASLDNQAPDEIVAVRHTDIKGIPDLVVGRIGAHCIGSNVVTQGQIARTPEDSDWVGVAVGDFDGSGKKRIAMLRPTNSEGEANTQLVLIDTDSHPNQAQIYYAQDLDSDITHPSAWKGLAAGNLEDIRGSNVAHGKSSKASAPQTPPIAGGQTGRPIQDELVAVRQVSDNSSATVLVYKWIGGRFELSASTGFGNDGNSDWAGVTVADFNADGRKSIVLVKNKHSNFTVFDLPPGNADSTTVQPLRKLVSSDLDSTEGQNWTGVAATDWLPGDHGANELIAVRSVTTPYRTNVFVYGDAFQLATRNSALESTKAQYAQKQLIDGTVPALMAQANIPELLRIMRNTHTNTFDWSLQDPHDYSNLVAFLNATKNFGVDGKQIRVWVTVIQPSAVENRVCSQPEDTRPTTTWNALDFFPTAYFDGNTFCADNIAWAKVIGRLAKDFPHLTGFAIDDFADNLNFGGPSGDMSPDVIARMEAILRAQAPWMSLIPTTYYDLATYPTVDAPWADIGLTLDTQLFYFRDQKQFDLQHTTPCASAMCFMPDGTTHPKDWGCLAGPVAGKVTGPCADSTIPNALGEFADMFSLLPAGRKMLGGVYFTGHSDLGTPSAKYDYELTNSILSQPMFAGALVYTLVIPQGGNGSENCIDDPSSYENFLDKYCTVWKVFSPNP